MLVNVHRPHIIEPHHGKLVLCQIRPSYVLTSLFYKFMQGFLVPLSDRVAPDAGHFLFRRFQFIFPVSVRHIVSIIDISMVHPLYRLFKEFSIVRRPLTILILDKYIQTTILLVWSIYLPITVAESVFNLSSIIFYFYTNRW